MTRINKLVDDKKTNNPDKLIVGTITPNNNQGYFYTKLSNYLYRILDEISNNKFEFFHYQQTDIKELKNRVDKARIVFFDTYDNCESAGALDEQMSDIVLSNKEELLSLLTKNKDINTIYTTSEEATVSLRKIIQGYDYYDKKRTSQKKSEQELKNTLNRDVRIIKLYSPARYAINRLGGGIVGTKKAAKKWESVGFYL